MSAETIPSDVLTIAREAVATVQEGVGSRLQAERTRLGWFDDTVAMSIACKAILADRAASGRKLHDV